MTKSELFKAAHSLTKQVIQAGDDYRATFAAALKHMLTKAIDMVEALTQAGGRLWEKGSMRRVYFNDLEALMGLSISRYKTGNICSASLEGEYISNSAAAKMLSSISKLWYDLADNKFYFQASDRELALAVVKNIRAKIA